MQSSPIMRLLLGLFVISACTTGEKRSATSSGAESTLVIAAIPTKPWSQSRPFFQGSVVADTQIPVADKDSLSVATPPVQLSPSPTGDSVTEIGGAIMPAPYLVHEYLMNGARYAAIEQEIGKAPNGQPVMGEVSRVTLPAMDSTEHLMFAGLCGIDGRSDAYVLAIVGIGEDSVSRTYRNIRKAWRFERVSKSFRKIPTTNVVCFDPGED
jgi:hypothetical protein